jgi:glycosyltransferase involved in cell wall biosynthesis
MKILQVSSTDLVGKRFNGQYLTEVLPSFGHHSKHLVWKKEGLNEDTHLMLKFPFSRTIQRIENKVEEMLSIRALLHPSSFLLNHNKHFRNSDVVHYQVMHWPNYFSIASLPYLTRRKPSVLTVHDLWPLTGHCVYPFDCTRWEQGCGSCPYLHTSFSMQKDRTRLMWNLKNKIYKSSKLDIVVASNFMKERVTKSPFFKGNRIHHVPFGLDLNVYSPSNQAFSKKILGIDENEIVISFRAAPNDLKGFDHIKEALRNLKTDKKVCLLTFNVKGELEEFRERFKIVDLGWVYDESLTLHAYNASDFFLMPSVQEAFGMMAMEAMAFGKPVVVFAGTSLPEVVGGSELGIVVPMGDVKGLTIAIQKLLDDPSFREHRGRASLKFAKENYSLDKHVQGLLKVYETAQSNF